MDNITINITKLKNYASNCSVLYVEDDEIIREQTVNFLKRFFPDIVVANDGQEGLEKYKQRDFDIIITDINMPHMNGIEMIKAIKKINYDQIILVTSAHNDSEYLIQLINLHVMKFVLKPFNNKQFLYVLYKMVESLSIQKEIAKKERKINLLLKNAQIIINHIKIGIVVIKKGKITMANRAFLDIGGFSSLESLKLEMPEIGVLFAQSSSCISAITNSEFIKEIQNKSDDEKKVTVIKDNKTYEYQVSLSKLEEEDSYVITFNDITAIHNALYQDEHTKLPTRKSVLEKIELLKQNYNSFYTIITSLKNFDNIEKWYGKLKAIDIEIEFAYKIKQIVNRHLKEAFIGYFAQNQFIIFSTSDKISIVEKELKALDLQIINESNQHIQATLTLHPIVKPINLNSNKELHEIEVDIISAFEILL